MRALAVTLFLLAVPAGHQMIWHNGWRKLLRASTRFRGPELPPTAHERAHAARSFRLRVVIEAIWALYLFGAIAIPELILK